MQTLGARQGAGYNMTIHCYPPLSHPPRPGVGKRVPDWGVSLAIIFQTHMSQGGGGEKGIQRTRSSKSRPFLRLPFRTDNSTCSRSGSHSASCSPLSPSSPSLGSSGKLTSHAVGRRGRCGIVEPGRIFELKRPHSTDEGRARRAGGGPVHAVMRPSQHYHSARSLELLAVVSHHCHT
jgi:hypothetical protein